MRFMRSGVNRHADNPLFSSRKRKADIFLIFAILVGIAYFVVEVVDPAPMDVEAHAVTAP